MISIDLMQLLSLFKGINLSLYSAYLPSVSSAEEITSNYDKTITFLIVILIYLVMSHIPLYGSMTGSFESERIMMGATSNTLMSFGIQPLILADYVETFLSMHLTSTPYNDYKNKHNSPRQANAHKARQELNKSTLTKLLVIVIAFIISLLAIYGGTFGNPVDLGLGNILLIIMQLVVSSLILVLLDELIRKKHTIISEISGTSLFICINIVEDMFWNLLSPTSIPIGKSNQFIGFLPQLMKTILNTLISANGADKAWYEITIYRSAGLYTVCSVGGICMTIVMTLLASSIHIKIQNIKRAGQVSMPLKGHRQKKISFVNRKDDSCLTLPLLYTGTTSLMMVSAAMQQFFMISKMLYRIAPHNGFSLICGKWKLKNHHLVPVGGLSYFIYGNIDSFSTMAIYVSFHVFIHSMTAYYMHYFNRQDVVSLSNHLTESQFIVSHHKNQKAIIKTKNNHSNSSSGNELYIELNRHNTIPMLAIVSGAILGLIAVFSTKATGIVIATLTLRTIMSNVYLHKILGMNVK